MKKNVYFIVIGAVFLGLLVGSLFFINSQPKKEELNKPSESSQEQVNKIFDKSVNDVESVVIKNSEGEFTIKADYKEDSPSYEIISSSGTQKPSQSMVNTFITELVNLIPEKIVEESCDDLSKYGLKAPTSSIKVTFKDALTKTLFLGNEAPLSLGNYLKIDDEKTVYLLADVNSDIFTNGKDYYFEEQSQE